MTNRDARRRRISVEAPVNVVVQRGGGTTSTSQTVTVRQHAGRTTTTREEHVVSDSTSPEGLTEAELDQQGAEALPEREQMSLVNANVAIPVNAAVAANVLSDGATAYADAAQNTPIDQSN